MGYYREYHNSIMLCISSRIRDLSTRLSNLGDGEGAAEAIRLAEATAFLETQINQYRATHVRFANRDRQDAASEAGDDDRLDRLHSDLLKSLIAMISEPLPRQTIRSGIPTI